MPSYFRATSPLLIADEGTEKGKGKEQDEANPRQDIHWPVKLEEIGPDLCEAPDGRV
jgi:hypothetical protein